MRNINTPLRSAQIFLAIVTVALNGYVTQWYLSHTLTAVAPEQTYYLLCLGAFTLCIALPYLFFNPALSGSRTLTLKTGRLQNGRFFNKYIVLALDAFCAAAWFAGFVALAQFQHGLYLCGGHVCELMVGGIVIGAFQCVGFAVAAGLAGVHVRRTRRGGEEGCGANSNTDAGVGVQMSSHEGGIGKAL